MILIIPAAIIEICLMLLVLVVSMFSADKADEVCNLSMKLPNFDWYFSKNKTEIKK